jgi:hypothetical protein
MTHKAHARKTQPMSRSRHGPTCRSAILAAAAATLPFPSSPVRTQDQSEKIKLGTLRFASSGAIFMALEPGDSTGEGLAQARLDVADIMKQVAWYTAQNLVEAGVDAAAMLDLSFVKGHFNAG